MDPGTGALVLVGAGNRTQGREGKRKGSRGNKRPERERDEKKKKVDQLVIKDKGVKVLLHVAFPNFLSFLVFCLSVQPISLPTHCKSFTFHRNKETLQSHGVVGEVRKEWHGPSSPNSVDSDFHPSPNKFTSQLGKKGEEDTRIQSASGQVKKHSLQKRSKLCTCSGVPSGVFWNQKVENLCWTNSTW